MIHLLQRTRDLCLVLLSLVLICNSRYNNNIKIANQLFVKKRKRKKKSKTVWRQIGLQREDSSLRVSLLLVGGERLF